MLLSLAFALLGLKPGTKETRVSVTISTFKLRGGRGTTHHSVSVSQGTDCF